MRCLNGRLQYSTSTRSILVRVATLGDSGKLRGQDLNGRSGMRLVPRMWKGIVAGVSFWSLYASVHLFKLDVGEGGSGRGRRLQGGALPEGGVREGACRREVA